jgi:phosphoserine phosphatase
MAYPLLFEYTYHMQVLTFVTPRNEIDFDLKIRQFLPDTLIEDRNVLEPGKAMCWIVHSPLQKHVLDQIRDKFHVDVIQQSRDQNPYKLFMADMDSTIVSGETLDDMASKAGIGEKVSEITKRAMAGEIDFEEALMERVALLSNLPVSIIHETLHEVQLNTGAKELLTHLKSKNIHCVLISGGFTVFTSDVANRLGFDMHFGNHLDVQGNILTGLVNPPILDKEFKQKKLMKLMQSMHIDGTQTMAIGDGANDLPMLETAGLGIGYFAKPLLQDRLVNRIEYTDLSSLIYVV